MDIIKHVKENMTGRMCDEQRNVAYLLEMIRIAGDGNYLEIGTLHGGSLCAVALWKKEHKQFGTCYAIDPLNGYYTDYLNVKKRGCAVDPITKIPVAIETVKANLRKFGVDRRVKIIQEKSDPFPLQGVQFAVTYIDGDHWGEAPLKDWLAVKDITTQFVIFDNYSPSHPDVIEAAHFAADDPQWDKFMHAGITYALRRKA